MTTAASVQRSLADFKTIFQNVSLYPDGYSDAQKNFIYVEQQFWQFASHVLYYQFPYSNTPR
ncbi:MAG TPA: hypothetical protein V6D33_16625 [Cyanophyceae cyanobacterium]